MTLLIWMQHAAAQSQQDLEVAAAEAAKQIAACEAAPTVCEREPLGAAFYSVTLDS